jgi:hypothetical protein
VRRIFLIILSLSLLQIQTVSYANEFACQRAPDTFLKDPIWTTSGEKDLKFVASWAFRDPENCIVGMMGPKEVFGDNRFEYQSLSKTYKFPTTWRVSRDGEMALVSGETEFSLPLLLSLSNKNLDGLSSDIPILSQKFRIFTAVKVKQGSGFTSSLITGSYSLAQLWGNWFSKNQGIHPENCEPENYVETGFIPAPKTTYNLKIIEYGAKPKVEISIDDPNDCVYLVYTGPLALTKKMNKISSETYGKTLAEYPYWNGEAAAYFDSILKSENSIIQVAANLDVDDKPCGGGEYTYNLCPKGGSIGIRAGSNYSSVHLVNAVPARLLSHTDSIIRVGKTIRITTSIDVSDLNPNSKDNVAIYIGTYRWWTKDASYVSGGWRVSVSGGTYTARYSKGGSLPGGVFPSYYTKAISIPVSDLMISPQQKAEAEAKAAAELKAKQEAEAKAAADKAAELKAKQDADAKLAADKAAAELKAKQEVEAKLAADKAAAELKAKQDADAKAAADKAAAATKKTTITCIKGKLTKKVTAVKPKCPSGYKVKK